MVGYIVVVKYAEINLKFKMSEKVQEPHSIATVSEDTQRTVLDVVTTARLLLGHRSPTDNV